jgi:hypothetical protein
MYTMAGFDPTTNFSAGEDDTTWLCRQAMDNIFFLDLSVMPFTVLHIGDKRRQTGVNVMI